jgi:hemoglobin-like flavoprotein
MDRREIALVQSTFAEVKPISGQAATLFYGRLFEIAPSVKPLFKGDMKEQGRKLMTTLAYVVNGLPDLPTILPAASALAKRHVSYGAAKEHYGPAGEALLWTLEKGLGPKWTPEAASAWAKAYATLSGFMIAEAYGSSDTSGIPSDPCN